VTITAVRVSPDLRQARILFRGLAGPEQLSGILEGLESARGFLRGELGRRLSLRYAPELSFEVDQSVDWSLKVAQLLREVQAHEADPATPEGAEAQPEAGDDEPAGQP
jgi:ribosome-binding factor A